MNYKACIIGCGRIAGRYDFPNNGTYVGTHARAYFEHDKFQISAICDHDKNNLNKFAKTWDVPNLYLDIDELIKNECPDVISICTPTNNHFDHLIRVIKSENPPKVIFLEKPVCEDSNQYEKILKIAEEYSILVLVNHIRRFDPGHRKVKEYISSGNLGKLINGKVTYYGDWLNNGCHIIDTLIMFFNEIDLDDKNSKGNFCVNIDKAEVRIEFFDEKYFQLYESDFRFENGRITINDFGSEINIEKVSKNEWGENVLTPISKTPIIGLDSPVFHAIDAIYQYLTDKKDLTKSGTTLFHTKNTMNIVWQVLNNG